jgi:hypothetical protein
MKNLAVEDTDKPGGKGRLGLFASTVKTGGKNEIKKYVFTVDTFVSRDFACVPGPFVFLDTKSH